MNGPKHYKRRERKPAKPLDAERLRQLALTYVARYSTSAAKLENYLRRKLRERGWSEDEEAAADPAALVAYHVEAGHIDDEAYARMRSGGILRRGYGQRRVDQTLYADGIDENLREEVRAGDAELRRAAFAMGRKRRFGPFALDGLDPAKRQKQIAAMLRAGHGFDAARAIVDAQSEAAVEEWVAEAPAEIEEK